MSCQICLNIAAKYSCPRCNVSYCGLKCYKSEIHGQCSESFYKQCVQEELASLKNDSNSKKKTLNALSRVADNEVLDEGLDSDDDEDLSSRLEGVDLDDPEAVWQALTPEERNDFKTQLNNGQLVQLVPLNEREHNLLWWQIHFKRDKIQELGSEKENLSLEMPKIVENSTFIDTSKASPMIKFNIYNVLFGYVITYRHLIWHQKNEKEINFVSSMLILSTNLCKNENFQSAEHAVQAGSEAAVSLPEVDIKLAKSDLTDILGGPGGNYEDFLYILAALADLKDIMNKAATKQNDGKVISKKKCAVLVKKIDFYSNWVNSNPNFLS